MSNHPVTKLKDAIREAKDLGIDVRVNRSNEVRFEAPGIPPKIVSGHRKTLGVDTERVFRKMRALHGGRRRRGEQRENDEAMQRALEAQAADIGRLQSEARRAEKFSDELVAEVERLEKEALLREEQAVDPAAHAEIDSLLRALSSACRLLGWALSQTQEVVDAER